MKEQTPSAAAYRQAAELVGCEPEAIEAIAQVEGAGLPAFDDNGQPRMLFERHLFSRYTAQAYDDVAPSLSNPTPGGYGKYRDQPVRLGNAIQLDRAAALRATSWGLFQVLGNNWKMCGFDSLEDFVAAMHEHVDEHLRACVGYIMARPHCRQALIDHDWQAFKRHYNGTGANPGYAHKVGMAYAALKRRA